MTSPPGQTRVLPALLAGATVTEAAKAAAVSRTSVNRWLREDFAFRAACNRLRHTSSNGSACNRSQSASPRGWEVAMRSRIRVALLCVCLAASRQAAADTPTRVSAAHEDCSYLLSIA
jgi:hypothetical protein